MDAETSMVQHSWGEQTNEFGVQHRAAAVETDIHCWSPLATKVERRPCHATRPASGTLLCRRPRPHQRDRFLQHRPKTDPHEGHPGTQDARNLVRSDGRDSNCDALVGKCATADSETDSSVDPLSRVGVLHGRGVGGADRPRLEDAVGAWRRATA